MHLLDELRHVNTSRPPSAAVHACESLVKSPPLAIEIFTDGSCLVNPGGPGGWAALIVAGDREREMAGSEAATTNNRMEMRAALEAMKVLEDGAVATIHTDSQYLRNGITDWIEGWKRRGWKRKGGEVKNVDLWQAIDLQNERLSISWTWVRGHAGHPQNERVDQLARQAAIAQAQSGVSSDPRPEAQEIHSHGGRYVAVCLGKPPARDRPGGWYARIRDPQAQVKRLAVRSHGESPQGLELTAAIRVVEEVPVGGCLTLHTPSEYLYLGATEWSQIWLKNGWKSSAGNAIANVQLWQRLLEACCCRTVDWRLLKGQDKEQWMLKAQLEIAGTPMPEQAGRA